MVKHYKVTEVGSWIVEKKCREPVIVFPVQIPAVMYRNDANRIPVGATMRFV